MSAIVNKRILYCIVLFTAMYIGYTVGPIYYIGLCAAYRPILNNLLTYWTGRMHALRAYEHAAL